MDNKSLASTLTNLDKAKTAYYEDSQAYLAGVPGNADDASIDAIFNALTPEEDMAFSEYRIDVDATMFPHFMKDYSENLRGAIDVFIQDGVQRLSGQDKVSDADRHAAISKISPTEALTAISIISHPLTQSMIYKRLMDSGMSFADIQRASMDTQNTKAA